MKSSPCDYQLPAAVSSSTEALPKISVNGVSKSLNKAMDPPSNSKVPVPVSQSQPVVKLGDKTKINPPLLPKNPASAESGASGAQDDMSRYSKTYGGKIFRCRVVLKKIEEPTKTKEIKTTSQKKNTIEITPSCSEEDNSNDADYCPVTQSSSSKSSKSPPEHTFDDDVLKNTENQTENEIAKTGKENSGRSRLRPKDRPVKRNVLTPLIITPKRVRGYEEPELSDDSDDETYYNPHIEMAPKCSTKYELKALYDVKNPQPSTSRTLRREMVKIHKAVAQRALNKPNERKRHRSSRKCAIFDEDSSDDADMARDSKSLVDKTGKTLTDSKCKSKQTDLTEVENLDKLSSYSELGATTDSDACDNVSPPDLDNYSEEIINSDRSGKESPSMPELSLSDETRDVENVRNVKRRLEVAFEAAANTVKKRFKRNSKSTNSQASCSTSPEKEEDSQDRVVGIEESENKLIDSVCDFSDLSKVKPEPEKLFVQENIEEEVQEKSKPELVGIGDRVGNNTNSLALTKDVKTEKCNENFAVKVKDELVEEEERTSINNVDLIVAAEQNTTKINISDPPAKPKEQNNNTIIKCAKNPFVRVVPIQLEKIGREIKFKVLPEKKDSGKASMKPKPKRYSNPELAKLKGSVSSPHKKHPTTMKLDSNFELGQVLQKIRVSPPVRTYPAAAPAAKKGVSNSSEAIQILAHDNNDGTKNNKEGNTTALLLKKFNCSKQLYVPLIRLTSDDFQSHQYNSILSHNNNHSVKVEQLNKGTTKSCATSNLEPIMEDNNSNSSTESLAAGFDETDSDPNGHRRSGRPKKPTKVDDTYVY